MCEQLGKPTSRDAKNIQKAPGFIRVARFGLFLQDQTTRGTNGLRFVCHGPGNQVRPWRRVCKAPARRQAGARPQDVKAGGASLSFSRGEDGCVGNPRELTRLRGGGGRLNQMHPQMRAQSSPEVNKQPVPSHATLPWKIRAASWSVCLKLALWSTPAVRVFFSIEVNICSRMPWHRLMTQLTDYLFGLAIWVLLACFSARYVPHRDLACPELPATLFEHTEREPKLLEFFRMARLIELLFVNGTLAQGRSP